MIPRFPEYVFIDDSTLVYQGQDNVIRSQMEVGPQKTRPIACKPTSQISFTARVCGNNDFKSFKDWFKDSISYGSDWFLLNDPITGDEYRYRFANTGIQWAKSGNIFTATFNLETFNG